MAIGQDALLVFPEVFPISKCLFADHHVFGVWWCEGRLLSLDLFPQNCLAGSCCDESQEGRGRVEGSAAEFGVGLQSNEEGVVCQ